MIQADFDLRANRRRKIRHDRASMCVFAVAGLAKLLLEERAQQPAIFLERVKRALLNK